MSLSGYSGISALRYLFLTALLLGTFFFTANATASSLYEGSSVYTTGEAPISGDSLAVGDFNGDAHFDLAVAQTQQVEIYANDGAGGFETLIDTIDVPNGVSSIKAEDVDADGNTDLLIGESGGILIVYYNPEASGVLSEDIPVVVAIAPGPVAEIEVGDINDDGRRDVVWIDQGTPTTTLGSSIALIDGNFTANADVSTSVADATGLVLGRFDSSRSCPDVYVVASGTTTLQRLENGSSCDGIFVLAAAQTLDHAAATAIAANLNGSEDDILELAVSEPQSDAISVLELDAAATESPSLFTRAFTDGDEIADTARPNAVIAADINAQGLLDLVAINSESEELAILLATASDSYVEAEIEEVSSTPDAIASADLDGDTKGDIVVSLPNAQGFEVFQSDPDACAGDGCDTPTTTTTTTVTNPPTETVPTVTAPTTTVPTTTVCLTCTTDPEVLVVSLKQSKRIKLKSLGVTVKPSRNTEFKALAVIKLGSDTFRPKPVMRKVKAGKSGQLRFKLTAFSKRKITTNLKKGRSVKVTITVSGVTTDSLATKTFYKKTVSKVRL